MDIRRSMERNIQRILHPIKAHQYRKYNRYWCMLEASELLGGFVDDMFVAVNDEKHKRNIVPCVKVYNSKWLTSSTMVARLHLKDSGMEYHDHDYKNSMPPWNIPKDKLEKVIELLSIDHGRGRTHWKQVCYAWNDENHLFKHDDWTYERYCTGEFDELLSRNKLYIPSTTKMPETWIFDENEAKKYEKYYSKVRPWWTK